MKSLKRLLSLTFLTSLALSLPAVSEEDDATKPKTKVADEFKQGDVVSAETFNQIFRTIERINKVAQDEDIDGSWICTAIHSLWERGHRHCRYGNKQGCFTGLTTGS